MLLRLDVDEHDDHAVVVAIGEIDASTSDDLAATIDEALDSRHVVLLDLAEVTFIDSSGLGVLVHSHRRAVAAAGWFAVVHPSRQTRKLITVLGLDELVRVFDSREQALAAR